MHYVGLDSAETAKLRVKLRVEHGGHGISDEDIERRYVKTFENLKEVLPLCDLAAIYDNSEAFRRFAIYKNGKCVRLSSNVPKWYEDIFYEDV
jgi:predicted ABC-type ATPase